MSYNDCIGGTNRSWCIHFATRVIPPDKGTVIDRSFNTFFQKHAISRLPSVCVLVKYFFSSFWNFLIWNSFIHLKMISSTNIDAIIKIINGNYGPEEWVTDVFKHFLDFSNSHALFTKPFVYYGCIASFLLQLVSESFKGPPQLCLGRRKSDMRWYHLCSSCREQEVSSVL